MARRQASASKSTTTKKRKERRAFIPAATIISPEQYVAPVTAMPDEKPTTAVYGTGRRQTRQTRTIGVPIDTDYHYVANDLRKILMTGGTLIGILAILAFVIH
jgi:hypothetical protein